MSVPTPTTNRFNEVVIIGAGFSGMNMACPLQRKLGHVDYVIYDRHSSIGGTWWANKYPGCAVDVPAAFYSLSFAPFSNFSKIFPPQAEVLAYMKDVAKTYNVEPHVHYRTEWKRSYWDDTTKFWEVKLQDLDTGEIIIHQCRILISAVGALVDPNPLKVPGANLFRGPIVHTAEWQPDLNLHGKDVVVVGNGASAAQLVPKIAPDARSVTQVIRTPQFYIRNGNATIKPPWRSIMLLFPILLSVFRFICFIYFEYSGLMFGASKWSQKVRQKAANRSRKYMKEAGPEKYWPLLIPKYQLGCKRRVFDNQKYLDCLHRPNLTLTNDPIVALYGHSVLTQSGILYPADIIILATGFSLTQWNVEVVGRNGRSRAKHWKEFGYIAAYQSIAMSGFPNFFYILGPNCGRGHTSTLYAIESYTNLVLRVIRPLLKGQAASVEVSPQEERAYNEKLHSALSKTVYTDSCRSYFTDSKTGRNWFIYPWSSFNMWYSTHLAPLAGWIYQ